MPTPSPVEDDDLPELVDYEPQAYVPPPNDAPSPTAGPNTVRIDLLRSSWTSPGRVPLHAVLLRVTDSWLETFYEVLVLAILQPVLHTHQVPATSTRVLSGLRQHTIGTLEGRCGGSTELFLWTPSGTVVRAPVCPSARFCEDPGAPGYRPILQSVSVA